MNDQELLAKLLNSQESDRLDFKSHQYDLTCKDGKSKFIKDIAAMANTPRDSAAYIVVGIEEQAGKVTGITGVTEHPDEAELGRIVSARVDPAPRFSYRQVSYKDKSIGLIEIPCDQPVPVLPRNDYGLLRRKSVYIRRNTRNTEADHEDLNRILQWSQQCSISVSVNVMGTWEQLYRACDAFDAGRIYVALMDGEELLDTRDWTAMAGVHWNMIIDFDLHSDTTGNHTKARDALTKRHALQICALDETPKFTARSTVWIAARGLESRPTTKPSDNWRDWNRTKGPRLEQTLSELARMTEPRPVTLIVFGGEIDYVSTACEMMDRAFTERVDYVFTNLDSKKYRDLADRFKAARIPLSLPDICEGLRDTQSEDVSMSGLVIPKLGGGTTTLEPARARWVEEQVEAVPWDVMLSIDDEETSPFLRGGSVSWRDLSVASDAHRELTPKLEQLLRRQLGERATRRVNLWHWPGAGASTVARRIAWNVHRDFPSLIGLELQPQDTAERIRYLFGVARLPILLVIDLPGVSKEAVDRLYDELRGSHIPVVLLNIERNFDLTKLNETHFLDAMLTTSEAVELASLLSAQVPSRQSDLESLIDESDRRKRTPFYFGLAAFERDFRGLESYVEARLSKCSESLRTAVLLIAFAYYYGQTALSMQAFGPTFGISASKRVVLSKVMPDYLRELLIEYEDKARPAHNLIAEEILEQTLGQRVGSRRNWRIGLADVAIDFIDRLADLPHQSRGVVSDTLRAVLIERGATVSPAGPWEAEFSRFLNDVPSIEGRQRVLEHLTEVFPEEPHFWAHLGRFYSRVVQDHLKADAANKRAISLSPNDSLLHHMSGMGRRSALYDLLDSLNRKNPKEIEGEIRKLVNEAASDFASARELDNRSAYSYISQVQMISRVIGSVSRALNYSQDTMRFLTLSGNDFYRELFDQAQNLLSDLSLIKGDESPSQLQVRLQANLATLHGKHSKAIQYLTNVLDRRETFKPPVRRAIIRAYAAKYSDDWTRMNNRELARVVELARNNIEEEPASDHNLRLWLRAVRAENTQSVDRVAERLAYKRLQNPSVDTTYYLYIMKFLQLELGDLAAANDLPRLIEECGRLARDLARTTTSFEWLGNGTGLEGLIHVSSLGDWDVNSGFWTKTTQLRVVRGRIAQIKNQGSGEIELPSGLRVFFIPARGSLPGGYVTQDIGREVDFFLGFSYDGLRAWSVRDP